MEQRESKFGTLAVLLTGAVFLLCLLAVLLTGAEHYRKLEDRGETIFQRNTAAGYLNTRLRQAAGAHAVAVENVDGADVLVLREEIGGKGYTTRIYCRDGALWELFSAEGGSFSPEDGERLLPLEALTFHREGNLLTAELTLSDGSGQQLIFCLTGRREALP